MKTIIMKHPRFTKKILLLLVFATSMQMTYAQDIIQTRKNEFIKCKIVNMTEFSIIYSTDNNIAAKILKDSVARFYIANYDYYRNIINSYPGWEPYYYKHLVNPDFQAITNWTNNNPSSEIKITSSRWSNIRYSYNGWNNLHYSDVKFLLKSNPEANNYINRAHANIVFPYIFGAIGGLCMVYALAEPALFKEPFKETVFFAGFGGFALAIPFNFGYSRNMRKAVEAYNKSVNK